jgi:hypothetical protein
MWPERLLRMLSRPSGNVQHSEMRAPSLPTTTRNGQPRGLRQPAAALVQAACCRITRLKARSSSEWLTTAGCGAESCSSPNSGNRAHLTEKLSDRKIRRKRLSAIHLSVTKFSGRLASAERKKQNRAPNFKATDDFTSEMLRAITSHFL